MRPILLATVFALTALPATAGVAIFQTTLDAAEEVPTNASTATGFAQFQFDSDNDILYISLDVDGLSAGLAAGHIHAPAPIGVNTGVAVGFPGLPVGETSFSSDGLVDLANPLSYTAGFLGANGGTAASAEAALLGYFFDGLVYANIHSRAFPGGEIRGQVEVPAPAALALFGLGVVALGAFRRR